jgi:hypothetical protein
MNIFVQVNINLSRYMASISFLFSDLNLLLNMLFRALKLVNMNKILRKISTNLVSVRVSLETKCLKRYRLPKLKSFGQSNC